MMHRTVAAAVLVALCAACSEAPTRPVAAPRADVVTAPAILDGPNAASAQLVAGSKVNLTIPTQFHAQNPCAGGRFGEIVVFTGDQHLVADEISNSAGHYSFKIHWNAENVTGIGQYTGFAYRATGVTSDRSVMTSGAYTSTMINNYHIIGQGQATNMDLKETVHVTVDANGWLTAYVTDYTFDCKQDPTF